MRLPLAALAIGCHGLDVPELPPRSAEATGLVLVVHGGGDDPSVWAEGLGDTYAAALVEPAAWDVVALDWSEDADAALTAARRGRRIGEALGPDIVSSGYEDLHLIAHSVGAHLAHGVATSHGGALRVQETLLDPFVGTGLVRWGFGRGRFGGGAAFAEAYVNTDDGVPSTDGALPGFHVFDVTDSRPAGLVSAEQGHRWPISFYEGSAGTGVGLDLAFGIGGDADWAAFPPGGTDVW